MVASEQARINRRREQSMIAQQAYRNRKNQNSTFHEEEAASHTHKEGFSLYARAALLRARVAELGRSLQRSRPDNSLLRTRKGFRSVMRELAVVESAIKDFEKGFTILNPVALASVLERTPTEIIVEIFRWTLSSELRGFSRLVSESQVLTAPWRLAHICREWRNAALGDPWLWSHIRIDACEPFIDFRSAYPMEALESQIQLSTSTPLQVDLRVDESTADIDHCVALFSAIAEHSDRWTHLTLLWGGNASILRGLSGVKGRLGSLSHLSLDYGHRTGPGVWPQELSDIFSIAPRLRKVETAHPDLFTHSSSVSVIWTSITHLELYAYPDLLLQVLKNVPNIAVFGFKEVFHTGAHYTLTFTAIVTLPHLARLACLGHSSHILQHLAAPKLEDLIIMSCPCDLHIPEFLKLSECHLQNLKLGLYRNSADAFGRLLGCVPTLIHLDVIWDGFGITAERLPKNVLRVIHRSSGFCLRLASLWVARPDDYLKKQVMEFETSLCEVIESRWNMPANDRSLRSIRIPSIIHSLDVRERFETMKMAGLIINDQGEPVPRISEEEYAEYVA